ncbi:MAG: DegV family protein [Clostridia bacterium]|nr:DegV family protein [Clostridia bacterium]
MKIAVSVESTHDLPKEYLTKYDIKVIPFEIILGDETFKDGEKTTAEMFAYVDKYGILPKTNAINEYTYTEYFESLKKEYDAVVHICLSSGITSTVNNAINAAKNVSDVYIVDSKSLSAGIGLLAIYARELANAGVPAAEIAACVQKRAEKVQTSFVVERLDYLYKGGRASGFQLLGANILKIRPRLVLKDGKMFSDKKYRGDMGSVIAKYGADILSEYNTPDLARVFITYTSATEQMKAAAQKVCEQAGFKEIVHTFAGGTIASHCGANTLGILYFNDGDK